jgi:lipid-A-disaccharide synthase-like uncharacterized protein
MTHFTAGILSFLIANVLISYIGSLLFTGDTKTQSFAVHKNSTVTFSVIFIGYCVIFGLIYLNSI